ncbi:MAG TPA: carboxypeptidase regulatory-like domain-containing protein [Gemmatimonadaceae bacterium]|nr:carboxypeptidase regulatory-like domain-containing protein [Gemmatimonadaceae bacterium]
MNRSRIALAVTCVMALGTACSGDKPASAAQPAQKREGSVPPRTTVVAAHSQPYRAINVSGGGKIAGTVQFDGAFPADSVIQLSVEQGGCGQSVVDRRVERSGNRVAGAAVWITDIREGRPIPLERRFELENEDCVMVPRLQTVVAGGTLNVISADVVMHRNKIIDVATGEVVGIAPFNDNGQVVPFDQLLKKTAQLEVVDELHPWSKANLLVLDHPYHAVTGKSGDFTIDGIPPGTYRLRAWHPALGVMDQTVTVRSGGQANVVMKLPGNGAPADVSPAPPATPESLRSAAPAR